MARTADRWSERAGCCCWWGSEPVSGHGLWSGSAGHRESFVILAQKEDAEQTSVTPALREAGFTSALDK